MNTYSLLNLLLWCKYFCLLLICLSQKIIQFLHHWLMFLYIWIVNWGISIFYNTSTLPLFDWLLWGYFNWLLFYILLLWLDICYLLSVLLLLIRLWLNFLNWLLRFIFLLVNYLTLNLFLNYFIRYYFRFVLLQKSKPCWLLLHFLNIYFHFHLLFHIGFLLWSRCLHLIELLFICIAFYYIRISLRRLLHLFLLLRHLNLHISLKHWFRWLWLGNHWLHLLIRWLCLLLLLADLLCLLLLLLFLLF